MDTNFYYQMLGRLVMDCEYYLGNGNKSTKYLWADTAQEHIDYMKEIYNALEEKPEWLTIEKIEEYEKLMITNND